MHIRARTIKRKHAPGILRKYMITRYLQLDEAIGQVSLDLGVALAGKAAALLGDHAVRVLGLGAQVSPQGGELLSRPAKKERQTRQFGSRSGR